MHLMSSRLLVAWVAILITTTVAHTLIGAATIADTPQPEASSGPRKKPHPARTPGPIALPPNLVIPRYPQGPEPFLDGETLIYEAAWEGIVAADARITLVHNRVHPGLWTAQMWINSSPLVDQLYRMRDYFRENFDYTTWQPSDIYIVQHEKSRQDLWRDTFDHQSELMTAVRTNKAGRTWIRRFSGGAPWGPFSGAMMALSQPLDPGQTYTFDIFAGGNRYVCAFAVLKREPITIGLGAFNALRIEPSMVWLSEGSFRSEATSVTIWVTDDTRHLPLRIESAVFIGAVRADLIRIDRAPARPTLRAPVPAPAPLNSRSSSR
jgi:hypothetical protein